MQKNISLHNREVSYTLKRSQRAKRMRLTVYCTGDFVVTVPQRLHEQTIEQYLIQKSGWITSKLDFFNSLKKKEQSVNGQVNEKELKTKAFDLVTKKIEKYNKQLGLKFNKVSIKNQKTCWGSCSKNRNLSFNWRIALLPDHLADYIVVHELCHLKEFSHSRRYWTLVSSIFPNYQHLIKELKANGMVIS